ncbi:hypothetical protein FFLO_05026 [Filobasidium floriforme]|uniref:Uncharacterized protein n=1 Tax=Filobasidium floriforme TaxID=5210 RepID=A0A8K0JIY8_9TREE|nr:uncharacterized protein HD553DRAFT_319298 [Filobasidium floriforme]KAG7530427.1 hypothetical protein FFLO_05026 [Filobasidium floriforme]KAH8078554.1 hypothetical protein HD553DRAFT_319298 [Filobasidium floriforme]
MMDPPSSPLGPPPTRLSHDHRRSITPETFYDADDALPPPPSALSLVYTSSPKPSGSKQPQPQPSSSSKPGSDPFPLHPDRFPSVRRGKRQNQKQNQQGTRADQKKQKPQGAAEAVCVYPGPEPPTGVSRLVYLEKVKEDEDIVTTMLRRVIDHDPRNVYNWSSPTARLSMKQKKKLLTKVVHPDLVILTGTDRCLACQSLVDPPDLPPNWVRWPCARILAQGPKRSCIACFRRDGGDTCKCTFAPLKGTSSAEPNPGLDYVSDNDNDNENEHDNDETEPGAQSRKAPRANVIPKDQDKDPLSPEEAARLRAHMSGMFRRYATLLGEYGEEIQDPDPNRVHAVPLEVIQDQIGKVQGSRFARLIHKGVR